VSKRTVTSTAVVCNKGINKRPSISNGSLNKPTKMQELLKAVFSLESGPRLCNEKGGSNTSTVALRGVGGDEKGTQCLEA
jgi:hypothetical protein